MFFHEYTFLKYLYYIIFYLIFKCESEFNYTYISIKDTGKGIKEEDLKFIWDKYYHSDKKHKRNEYGTGLGLSIVKNILQNHGYKYGVKSSSKGTTFYFEIQKDC